MITFEQEPRPDANFLELVTFGCGALCPGFIRTIGRIGMDGGYLTLTGKTGPGSETWRIAVFVDWNPRYQFIRTTIIVRDRMTFEPVNTESARIIPDPGRMATEAGALAKLIRWWLIDSDTAAALPPPPRWPMFDEAPIVDRVNG